MLNRIRTQWQQRGEGGWSLTELLMTLAISTIGVGAAFAMVSMGHRHVQRGDVVTGMQQQSRTSVEWMARELRESALDSIVISGEASDAISFSSARDTAGDFQQDENATPQWQQAIVYYLKPGTTQLYRYATPKTDWSQLVSPSTIIEQSLGECISSDVASLAFALNGLLANITIETVRETISGAAAKNALSTNVVLRNRL